MYNQTRGQEIVEISSVDILPCEIHDQMCNYTSGLFDPYSCCGCYYVTYNQICYHDIRKKQYGAFLFQLFFGYVGAGYWYLCNNEIASILFACSMLLLYVRCYEINRRLDKSKVGLSIAYSIFTIVVISLAFIGTNRVKNECDANVKCVPIPWACE